MNFDLCSCPHIHTQGLPGLLATTDTDRSSQCNDRWMRIAMTDADRCSQILPDEPKDQMVVIRN